MVVQALLSDGTSLVLPQGNFFIGDASNIAVPATPDEARTGLGGTTVGQSVFLLANPSAITFIRINADNSVSALDAASFRAAIGAGSGGGDALTSQPLSQFAATTSAQLAGVITDETGSGLLVFGTSPTIVTPIIASFTNANHNHTNAAGGGQLGTSALSLSAYSMIVNNTNATAAAAEQTYKNTGIQTYAGTDTWDGTPPSSVVAKQYQIIQIGKKVELWMWITYTTAGTSNTSIDLTLPSDMPLPIEPTGRTGTNDVLFTGVARLGTSTSQVPNNPRPTYIVKTGTGTYKMNISAATTNARTLDVYISYISV